MSFFTFFAAGSCLYLHLRDLAPDPGGYCVRSKPVGHTQLPLQDQRRTQV
jgi:hypothetical protein